jgi:anti-sigma regulatory factor (Ser/Thr protein kinase)
VRVAQLVQQQHAEVQTRERLEQELRVARLIQQTLLPKELPALPGWKVSAYYQPARAVGGDFYDFLYLPEGRLGIVVGDVTDKGVPAALVMATTRSLLRSVAQSGDAPGWVLERVNDALVPDIPARMFVTCLYAVLDPASGRLQYANAGHDLPYRRHDGGAEELRATGMPLGLMPGMRYEEREVALAAGESVLFYSDGLVEAHDRRRQMFGFPRLKALVAGHTGGAPLIDYLLAELRGFAGPEWEQEDDVTLVTLERGDAGGQGDMGTRGQGGRGPSSQPSSMGRGGALTEQGDEAGAPGGIGAGEGTWWTLAEFRLASEPGNERLAMERVAEVVAGLALPAARRERLKTAVAEATMNAIEHGNKNRSELPVEIRVLASERAVAVRITDQGGGSPIPRPETPDLEAKLAGLQTARGWGLFLIEKMVDEMRVVTGPSTHTIELILRLGEEDGSEGA